MILNRASLYYIIMLKRNNTRDYGYFCQDFKFKRLEKKLLNMNFKLCSLLT